VKCAETKLFGALESRVDYEYDGSSPDGARDLLTAQVQYGQGGVTRTTTFLEYDGEGRPLRERDPAGRDRRYGYDALGRPTSVQYCTRSGGPGACTAPVAGDAYETESITFRYDGQNNVTRIEEQKLDRTGAPFTDITERDYDLFDRLDDQCYARDRSSPSASCSGGVTFDYDYDNSGNRTLVALGSRRTDYAYDARNRLKHAEIDGSSTERVEYRYFADGRLGFVGYPNGTQLAYSDSFDGTGRQQSRAPRLQARSRSSRPTSTASTRTATARLSASGCS